MQDAAQARRSAAFAAAAEAFLVFDAEGVITDLNDAACRLLAIPAERLVGQRMRPDAMVVVRADGSPYGLGDFPVTVCLTSRTPVAPALMGFGPDEARLWVQCSAAPLPGGGVVAMMIDVTEQVEAERSAREAESLYQLVADNAVDVVAVWRPGIGEVFVSPSVERVTGWSMAERAAGDDWHRVHPDDRDRMRELHRAVEAGETEAATEIFRALHADRQWYWHEIAISAVTGDDGVVEVHSAVRDVTDRVEAEQRLRESEERHRLFAENSVDAVTVWRPGVGLEYASPSFTRMLGWTAADLPDERWQHVVHPDDVEAAGAMASTIFEGAPEASLVYRVAHRDGGYRWIEHVARALLDADEHVVGMQNSLRDVTARVETEAARRSADARWQAAFAHGPIGQVLLSPSGLPLAVNGAMLDLVALAEADFMGVALLEQVHPGDRDAVEVLLAKALAGDHDPDDAQARIGREGRWRWCRWSASPVTSTGPGVDYLVVQVLDIDENVRIGEVLRHQAAHDALTGLANRTEVTVHLREALERAEATGQRVAVCFVDLDGFKAANDSLGHAIGDQILTAVADRLRAVSRRDDVVARFGGDEFLVVAEGLVGDGDATLLARRLHSAFEEPLDIGGHRYVLTASIGVAESGTSGGVPAGTDVAAGLLRDADHAMYQAKRLGRARWVVFDEAMSSARIDRFALERELRDALDSEQIQVFYQPVVSLASGGAPDSPVVGYEALVRWQHPERGLLQPDQFLGVAEDSDLIVPLGRQVIETAIREAASWGPDAPFVAVNVSVRQLAEVGLAAMLEGALTTSGLDPAQLVVEVTESTLLEGGAAVAELRRLDAHEVRIALDDFGTGYSSLTHLQSLPISVLKLDGSFVAGLGRDDDAGAIVASVVQLAHALGLPAIAEGVETAEQARLLSDLGCDWGQGWYFAAAAPAPSRRAVAAQAADPT